MADLTSSGSLPPFIVKELDDFAQAFDQVRQTVSEPATASDTRDLVRRPMRGIQLRQETFATIFVRDQLGQEVKIANSSAPDKDSVSFTSNFILQAVSRTRTEKFQPISTFGPTYGFFFGEQPQMMNFSALLLDTADFQWDIEWWENYENYFRGTQLTDRAARAYLAFDEYVVEGYVIAASTSKQAMATHEVNLQFTMWVTAVETIAEPGDVSYPTTDSSSRIVVDEESIRTLDGFVSSTAAVRAANIKALSSSDDVGLLGKLRAKVAQAGDFIDSKLDSVRNFLYGRNLVIPAGFVGSEQNAGRPVFASGSGFEALGAVVLPGGATLNIRLPASTAVTVQAIQNRYKRSRFYDNFDEYPRRQVTDRLRPSEQEARFREMFAIPPSQSNEEVFYYTNATEAFQNFGLDANNQNGLRASEMSQFLGKATFAVVSYGATYGATDILDSLTVGNAAGAVNDAQEQAAAEALAEQAEREALEEAAGPRVTGVDREVANIGRE